VALVAASLSAWLLTEDARDGRIATTLVILIAAGKMHLVVSHFMEVPWAARPWRQILAAWILLVALAVLGCYWFALPAARAGG
jgi:lipopolysaccharide export LptBFGC system permease protein LptF